MNTTDNIPDINDLNITEKWAPQLGYAEEPETPLTADTFPSKSGGKPAWLNPEKVLGINDVTCGLCEQPMVLLVQLYTPEDFPPEAFHRTVYVFCCKNGTCVKQDWKKCFKVYRSQLPRENPYYPPPPEDDEEEDIDFIPKTFKAPTLCVICGIEGSKACGQCKSVHYCSREHQMVDWNMCLHKQYCKKIQQLTTSEQQQIEQLRKQRIFREMEIVSEAEGRGQDGIEEDAQLEHTLANSKNDNDDDNDHTKAGTEKALVPIGEEQEEDTKVDVDDTFLKFQLRIQLYPEQILRYDRVEYDMPDREPLWVQEDQKPPTTIPPCDQCGGPRTFEFQLLSTLLNFLGVSHIASDSLDWGSLYIYSCKRNCAASKDQVFIPEYIWKQDFSSHGMNLGGNPVQ